MTDLTTAASIDALADVDTTTTPPTEGQRLVYRSGLWVPETVDDPEWQSASLTFDHGGWKGEVLNDPAPTLVAVETEPAEPTYSFTVAESDVVAVTGLVEPFSIPTMLALFVSCTRLPDETGTTYAALHTNVKVNGVDHVGYVLGTQVGYFATVSLPVKDLQVGDVVDVYLWCGTIGASFSFDWRGYLTTAVEFPKVAGDVPYLITGIPGRDAIMTLESSFPVPATPPATGTWAPSVSTAWYSKTRGEPGDTSGPRIFDVTGPDEQVRFPSMLGKTYGTGQGYAHSANRRIYMHYRVTDYAFRYLLVPNDT